MTTMMDETGQMCRTYLEKLVGTDKPIVIWGHKSLVKIKDIESFHKIAQSSEIEEIGQLNRLFYIIDVPSGGKSFPEQWTITLDEDLTKDFKRKYGEKYEITN